MGFMDKAKKLADQAQAKLDEAQKQFNERGSAPADGPPARYDQHGRPVPREDSATPPHGDPVTGPAGWTEPTPATSAGAPATPGVPPTEPRSGPPEPVEGDDAPPPMPGAPGSEDRPPKLTGGDPLAG